MRFDKSFIIKTLPEMSIAFGHFPEQATFSIDSRDIKPGIFLLLLKALIMMVMTLLCKHFKRVLREQLLLNQKRYFAVDT